MRLYRSAASPISSPPIVKTTTKIGPAITYHHCVVYQLTACFLDSVLSDLVKQSRAIIIPFAALHDYALVVARNVELMLNAEARSVAERHDISLTLDFTVWSKLTARILW